MLVNGTHVRRLDLDGKAAAEPPFAAEMRDHTFLQPHTTPQNVGGPHLFEGQSASGTADGVIIENMDIDVRKYPKIPGLTLMWAHHILVRNVRVRHAPTGIGIRLKKSRRAGAAMGCRRSPRRCVKQPVGPNPTKDGYNIRCEESQWSHFTNIRLSGGSSGIEFTECSHAHVRNADIRDMRGSTRVGSAFSSPSRRTACSRTLWRGELVTRARGTRPT